MTETIATVLIDDETASIKTLSKLLEKYCPKVNIIATAQSVEEGTKCIDKNKPDLIFLDINMPDGDGFEILEKVTYKAFEVIFITAYDRYAIKAFEFSALHYLLKPIKHIELQQAVERFTNIKRENNIEEKIRILNDTLNNKVDKMILPSSNGLSIIELNDIIRCESSNNYTTFYLISGEKIVVSKSINNYEMMLADLHFARVHSKHLINLKYVKKYVKGRGGYVVLRDKIHVDVSEGKKKDFLLKLNKYARG